MPVSAIDPADPNATQDEFEITRDELSSPEQLELAEESQPIRSSSNDLGAVVAPCSAKAKAADVTAADAAQLEIDTAEVDARAIGRGRRFLPTADSSSTPARSPPAAAAAARREPPTPVAELLRRTHHHATCGRRHHEPPVDDGTTTPPADDGGGGITP